MNQTVLVPHEYKKIFCAYHTSEFLTNFCLQPECLMPMCPSCVAQHTEEHYVATTKPKYVNLNELLAQTKDQCYASISRLEKIARQNSQISSFISGFENYIRSKLFNCLDVVYKTVEAHFTEYGDRLIAELRQKYKKESVYNQEECENLAVYIDSQVDSLYDKVGLLKSDQCLSGLIRFYSHDQQEYQTSMKQMEKVIDHNKRSGGLCITFDEDAIVKATKGICEQVIKVAHVTEEDIEKAEMQKSSKSRPLDLRNRDNSQEIYRGDGNYPPSKTSNLSLRGNDSSRRSGYALRF